MISILLISLSLDMVKFFAPFIMLSVILSDPQGVDCGLFSFMNHSCHSKGSFCQVFISVCFLASLLFPKMSSGNYSQVGLSSVT